MRDTIGGAASPDLEEASDYGDAVFEVVETHRYLVELDTILKTIVDFPELPRERGEYQPPVRIHRHRHHYLVYTVQPDGVRILRVLRVELDLDRSLRRTCQQRPLLPPPETRYTARHDEDTCPDC